jgi:hypothetical protein
VVGYPTLRVESVIKVTGLVSKVTFGRNQSHVLPEGSAHRN